MKITSLGHDGYRYESADGTTALLINPWLDPAGAYAGTWLPWPDNSHVREAALANVSAVVVTSARLDHLCSWTLGQLPPDVPVIIPRLPAPGLQRAVERVAPGRPVTVAEEWAPQAVGSGSGVLTVTLVSDLETNPECAVVVQGDGQLALDLNRARIKALPLRTIRQLAGEGEVPDFVAVRPVPANGPAWGAEWPTADKRASALRRERLRGMEYAVQALRVLQAQRVVPLAGSPALVDVDADAGLCTDLVETPTHLHHTLGKRMVRGLQPMNPGDSVDLATEREWLDTPDEPPAPDRRDAVAALVAQRQAELDAAQLPPADDSLRATFEEWFGRLLNAPGVASSLNLRLGFDVGGASGGHWAVDFRSGQTGLDFAADLDECDYVIRVPAAWLQATLTGHLTWEDLVGSLQLRLVRGPRHRKDQPLMLLRHATPEPEEALTHIRATLAATRTVRLPHEAGDDGVLEFERYCPHAGLDLLDTGELVDTHGAGSRIRCIAHHYEFDLATGACHNAECRPLRLGPDPGE